MRGAFIREAVCGERLVRKLTTLGSVVASAAVPIERSGAQAPQLDVGIGLVSRDTWLAESTNRWGGQLRVGLLAPAKGHVSLHFAASASGFLGPGDTPTRPGAVSQTVGLSQSVGIGGLGTVAGVVDMRWYSRTTHDGPFISVGGGATLFEPGNASSRGMECWPQGRDTSGRFLTGPVHFSKRGMSASPESMVRRGGLRRSSWA